MSRRDLVFFLAAAIFTASCAGIQYSASYESAERHEPLPLRSTVTVLISPELRKEMKDEAVNLEEVRQTFALALSSDLGNNGPLTPVADDPEARLEVVLTKAEVRENKLFIIIWFLAPLWLFGVPTYTASVDLAVDVKLTSDRGDQLFQTSLQAACKRYEGIYYGHQPLAFGCPAKEIAERMREQMSMTRSEILARQVRSRPKVSEKEAKGPAPIVAVFLIHDMTEQFDERLLVQLTEFLSAQVAQKLGFKVVPREQLRASLAHTKAESMKACYDESCQIELGKAVAANKTLSTTLIRVGKRCAFNANLYDLKTETTDRAASVETTCDEDALLDGVKNVVLQLGTAKH